MKQGSLEWFESRKGKITASRFGDVITEPKAKKDAGQLGLTAKSYVMEIVTEILTGESQNGFENEATDWGTLNEPLAIETYELMTFNEVQEVGFVEMSEWVGGSPDGLVGENGMIEVKCPHKTHNHIKYLLGDNVPKNYYAQIQGNLWITNRTWCDFISYDPRIQNVDKQLYIKRIERDEEFIKNLESKINLMIQEINCIIDKIK
jgi:putative phage-type endonuclease